MDDSFQQLLLCWCIVMLVLYISGIAVIVALMRSIQFTYYDAE
jgi:hypothetical protein